MGWDEASQGFTRPQGVGMGQENFPRHAGRGRDRERQNLVEREQKPHPSDTST